MMASLKLLTVICLCFLVSVKAYHHYPMKAECKVKADSGSDEQDIKGDITLEQATEDGPTKIKVMLEGFATDDVYTKHGFHIHQDGVLTSGCVDAGGHYNPDNVDHAGPMDNPRHVGDLGNVDEVDGKVDTTITDTVVKLSGSKSVMGRAIVEASVNGCSEEVHLDEDDLGKGTGDEEEESKKTGNAGARIACCVIEAVTMTESGSSSSQQYQILAIFFGFLLTLMV